MRNISAVFFIFTLLCSFFEGLSCEDAAASVAGAVFDLAYGIRDGRLESDREKTLDEKEYDTFKDFVSKKRRDVWDGTYPLPPKSTGDKKGRNEERKKVKRADDHHSWSYHGTYGPSNWSFVASDCSSDRPRQSPINIVSRTAKVDETMTDVRLVVDHHDGQLLTMVNNGHTVNLVFDSVMRISGGKLGDIHRVAGVHFHWGATDTTGSEHTVNQKHFPLEMHIVSYNEERFAGISDALQGENSLAVLGVLFKISPDDNPSINPIISNLKSVQKPDTSISIPYFDLQSLLPPHYSTHFYRYLGSLTTPPCSEKVIWTVFKHTQNISQSQMEKFRQLYSSYKEPNAYEYMDVNWRPVQPIHDRGVITSFVHDSKEDDHHHHKEEDHSHSWAYYGMHGPSNWSLMASDCAGSRQSPINIVPYTTKVDETMTEIKLSVDYQKGQKVTMINNGHTVNLVFDSVMEISGGKLENVHRVAGVHFHWGAADYTGSEHSINSERFPLEMHIVSYDERRFAGIPEALKGENSLAVLGVLFTISKEDNPAIEPLISQLPTVQKPDIKVTIPYFDLRKLLPPHYSTHFYRYLGSLTTPPCSEKVIWTVFKNVQTISHAQVGRFRLLYSMYQGNETLTQYEFMRFNWRPVQPLHDRMVIRTFIDLPSTDTTTTKQTAKPKIVTAAPGTVPTCKMPSSADRKSLNVMGLTLFIWIFFYSYNLG